MTDPATAAENWKKSNAGKLIDCRWGCKITVDSCHAYQSRNARYVLHFNGERTPAPRANAEYLRCFFPEPCSHFLSDEEARAARELRDQGKRSVQSQIRQNQRREVHRLVNPDEMLREPQWLRSLLIA